MQHGVTVRIRSTAHTQDPRDRQFYYGVGEKNWTGAREGWISLMISAAVFWIASSDAARCFGVTAVWVDVVAARGVRLEAHRSADDEGDGFSLCFPGCGAWSAGDASDGGVRVRTPERGLSPALNLSWFSRNGRVSAPR